jgi:hypothetical protein
VADEDVEVQKLRKASHSPVSVPSISWPSKPLLREEKYIGLGI